MQQEILQHGIQQQFLQGVNQVVNQGIDQGENQLQSQRETLIGKSKIYSTQLKTWFGKPNNKYLKKRIKLKWKTCLRE